MGMVDQRFLAGELPENWPAWTNRDLYIASDRPLCEWEPCAGRPAMLSDPFHSFATLRVGARECFTFRVCEDCARSRSLARRELPTVPLNGGY